MRISEILGLTALVALFSVMAGCVPTRHEGDNPNPYASHDTSDMGPRPGQIHGQVDPVSAPDAGPYANQCEKGADCPSGEWCFWNWDGNPTAPIGRNVCLPHGGPTSFGCRLRFGKADNSDCGFGLYCLDPDNLDPDAGPKNYGVTDVMGCCSTYGDHCS